jgi:hypothetical protein
MVKYWGYYLINLFQIVFTNILTDTGHVYFGTHGYKCLPVIANYIISNFKYGLNNSWWLNKPMLLIQHTIVLEDGFLTKKGQTSECSHKPIIF